MQQEVWIDARSASSTSSIVVPFFPKSSLVQCFIQDVPTPDARPMLPIVQHCILAPFTTNDSFHRCSCLSRCIAVFLLRGIHAKKSQWNEEGNEEMALVRVVYMEPLTGGGADSCWTERTQGSWIATNPFISFLRARTSLVSRGSSRPLEFLRSVSRRSWIRAVAV